MEGDRKKPADLMTEAERAQERAAAKKATDGIFERNLGVKKDSLSSRQYLVPAQPEPEPDPHSPQEELHFVPPKETDRSRAQKTPHQESFEF